MKEKVINWNKNIKVELKESENTGLIIDVFNRKTGSHIDSITIWYDDLTEDKNEK